MRRGKWLEGREGARGRRTCSVLNALPAVHFGAKEEEASGVYSVAPPTPRSWQPRRKRAVVFCSQAKAAAGMGVAGAAAAEAAGAGSSARAASSSRGAIRTQAL
jgi:hypothetical protein